MLIPNWILVKLYRKYITLLTFITPEKNILIKYPERV